MPIAKEISNMLDVGRKPLQSIPSSSLQGRRKGRVGEVPFFESKFDTFPI